MKLTTRIQHHNLNRNGRNSNWTIRRRIIALTLTFCAGCVAYILYYKIDTRTAETIAQSAFALAGAVVGSYVFGATWEDRKKMDILSDQQDQDQPQQPQFQQPNQPAQTPPPPNVNNPDVQAQLDGSN